MLPVKCPVLGVVSAEVELRVRVHTDFGLLCGIKAERLSGLVLESEALGPPLLYNQEWS